MGVHVTGFAAPDDQVLLTVAEAAAMLRMSTSAVRAWAAKGTLPGALPKLGGKKGTWRIRRTDLINYLASAAPATKPES